jgi:sortase A
MSSRATATVCQRGRPAAPASRRYSDRDMSLSEVGAAAQGWSAYGPRGPGSTPPQATSSGRPPLSPTRRVIREIGLALITAGVVLLLFVGYQLFGTNVAEASSQRQLKQQFEHPVAPPAAARAGTSGASGTAAPGTTGPPATSSGASAPTGDAVAHLVIPKIGVDKFIVEGVALTDLRKGPGHYPTTPLPGEKGNAAIAGHRTTYGAPFYRINELQPGDDIFVTTKQGKFHYTVIESKVVSPNAVFVLDPTSDNRLTLTTCNPRFSAAQRLVVVSRLVDPPAPAVAPVNGQAPAGVAAGGPLDLGSGDPTAWPPTLLFGALALLLWIGVRLAGIRLPRGRRWIPFAAGIPLALVPLWFLFENVIRLLPANI